MQALLFFKNLPILSAFDFDLSWCEFLQDDELIVFDDRFPDADNHLLVCSTECIRNINALKPQHLPLRKFLLLTSKFKRTATFTSTSFVSQSDECKKPALRNLRD